MSLAKSSSGAFFTECGYLSINRDYIKDLIADDELTINVEGRTFNINRLLNRITYNEHKNVMRWEAKDFRSARV